MDEIREVARFLRARTEDPVEPIRNLIVLGDFNIFTAGDATMRALTEDGGFTRPRRREVGSRAPTSPRDKKYDQIAFRSAGGTSRRRARRARSTSTSTCSHDDAVYRPYIDAYIDERRRAGARSPKPPADAAAARRQFNLWRTYQMSDHLPLWAEFRVDFADDYLTQALSRPPVP